MTLDQVKEATVYADQMMDRAEFFACEGVDSLSDDGQYQAGIAFAHPETGQFYAVAFSMADPTPDRVDRYWEKLWKSVRTTFLMSKMGQA